MTFLEMCDRRRNVNKKQTVFCISPYKEPIPVYAAKRVGFFWAISLQQGITWQRGSEMRAHTSHAMPCCSASAIKYTWSSLLQNRNNFRTSRLEKSMTLSRVILFSLKFQDQANKYLTIIQMLQRDHKTKNIQDWKKQTILNVDIFIQLYFFWIRHQSIWFF